MFRDNKEFQEWAGSIGLSDQAIAVIKNIRESDPARRVRSGPFNVGGRFTRSRKMSHTIQHESRTVEFPALLMMELDYLYDEDDVLEIWDQPPSFVVNYESSTKKNIGHYYTADFFVIRRNSAGWEEWKAEENLHKQSKKNPAKYYLGDDGIWHFPPGENYASTFNLYFHVHSSSEINWTLHRNLKLLVPFYNSSFEVSSLTHKEIQNYIKITPGVSLSELKDIIPEANNLHVFQLLLTSNIFIDLQEAWLGEDDKVKLFPDKTTFEFFIQSALSVKQNSYTVLDIIPNSTVRWDGLTLEVVVIGNTEIILRSGENNYITFPHQVFEQFIKDNRVTDVQFRPVIANDSELYKLVQNIGSSESLRIALDRFKIILPALNSKKITDASVSNRTHKNWIKAYEISELKTGDGLLGLIPRNYKKGNRTDRLEKESSGLRQKMENFIGNNYETIVGKTKSLAYGEFCLTCESEGIQAPSYKTFVMAINHRLGPDQTKKIKGEKASYQEEEFIDWSNGIPIHGDRAWEYVHIDHTKIDVELKHSIKTIIMAVAWISIMFDSFTRKVLAYLLSFDPPSYRSCLGLIRECVRLHGRVPDTVIVDGGTEFQSIYFEKLSARCKFDVIWRPPSKPRFGCLIERFIHTLNKNFIHNLLGNRKLLKNPRQITKKVNPKKNAVWNFPLLDLNLEDYFYNEYSNKIHSGLGQTPNEAYAEGLMKFPTPFPERIVYDDQFLIDTMPSPRKSTVKLTSRGVKFMGYYYRSKKIRRPELYGEQIQIRYDPFSYAHVYVLIKNEWIECLAPAAVYTELKNKTEREVKIITEEKRALIKTTGRKYKEGLIETARNHLGREAIEQLEKQRLQDSEFRKSAEQRGIKLSPSRSHLVEDKAPDLKVDLTVNKTESIETPKTKVQIAPFPRALKKNKE